VQFVAVSVVPLLVMHAGILAGVDTVLVVVFLVQLEGEGVYTKVGYVIVVVWPT